ncbi:putative GCN5-related N-acetyltransferase [Vibrio ichthyoenteri ATCC 700023]|uniref:Putative GCN5-related N-acetyltransferase n=1 Tax=Vibrio ichthyoenteri ATCC 700023 TaxID=870968 RepID=F9S7M1_9VIBR|nr:GNAT family N-acetyltransferase [Vibrio ichthyoenteri]EGU31204.1 putative GCN5-related N-acetyltransferase [Vibrio ichthyoenteri ATCC 700023]
MGIKIRHLETMDNRDLFDIYSFTSVSENTSQLPFLSSDKVASFFTNPDNYTLVAEVDSKVVAHVTLFLTTKVRDRHCAGLAIAVHPEVHGQGVGRALMVEALNQADNWINLVRIELDVHTDNAAAIALYKSVGFDIEGTKRLSTFKAGRYIDMYLMSRLHPNHQYQNEQ